MKSRDRVAAALNFEQTDRPPFTASFVPEVAEVLREQRGIDEPDLGVALGNDLVVTSVGLEQSFYGGPKPEYVDEWGIRWRWVSYGAGAYTEIADPPLAADESKLDAFETPDPTRDDRFDRFREMKRLYGDEKWIVGSCQISIFEAAWYLRGLDTFLMDMVERPEYCHRLMDKTMGFSLGASRKYIELGADMVWFGDDVAMQTGMMMSVEMWREFLRPRYARLFESCKSLDPSVKIAYHSDGNCEAILDDMIEIGLDVLNPLQPAAIDPVTIKKRYGSRLSLFGGMCIQHTLPHGTAREVRDAVRRLQRECGAGGGFILAPSHHMQVDTPMANIEAYYEAAMSTGC